MWPRTEHCNRCGLSVRIGSGRFVNRIHDFNDFGERFTSNRPFPAGDFICTECDGKRN